MEEEYTLQDFDYNLPENLIAQKPAEKRDQSRLFVLTRKENKHTHTVFNRLNEFLDIGDLLVFNNTKVLNARIYCRRESGGAVEIVLTRELGENRWFAVTNRTKRLRPDDLIFPAKDSRIEFRIAGRSGDYIEIVSSVELTGEILARIGEVPLPPYIRRESIDIDIERYQTVYASQTGAFAAPTAGLHFTDDVLKKLNDFGVETAYTTLHVSWGTFSPVRENDLSRHKMHSEKFILDKLTAERINSARENNKRVVAVGTTSLRVLESTFQNGRNIPGEGETDIFIYPPYRVRSADALLTNFHTPGSTLLMLVSAFAGYEQIMDAYRTAVKLEYRFFSYGDAMLII